MEGQRARRRSSARSHARGEAVPLPATSIPRATYRVQLHGDFRFTDAAALVDYLATLGISHLYCSPYLRARPGSRHGYDIVDHTMLNPEIGTREDFDAMVDTLARHGMSHLCDIVPNHMAVMGHDNAWWMDVLENGPASRYAAFFDIDWSPQDRDLAGKVLIPILGDPYGAVLERGELQLGFERETGTFALRYYEHRLPLDPRECAPIVELALAALAERLRSEAVAEGESLVHALGLLPARSEDAPERVAARRRDVPLHKRRLAQLAGSYAPLAEAIDTIVQRFNGTAGVPQTFEALDTLLEAQAFRLAHWRVASDEINYRRFFDINDLASLRMEDEGVFQATHGFLLGLAAQGKIGGFRIDHPDGLHDPAGYFRRLQTCYRELAAQGNASQAESGIYVVIEKISAPHEHLPADWAVHGDTGYPFANEIHAVLVDPTVRRRVDRVWRALLGEEARSFEVAAYEGKRDIMRGSLAAGLNGLASHALKIARSDRRTRDFTLNTLREAIAETVAWFPVYRTYVTAEGHSVQDRRYIDWAVSRARRATRFADRTIFDFIRALLLASPPDDSPASVASRYLDFAMRFQQYTAPVAAKGVEDTSFYTHTRLISSNDVGGDPEAFGMTRKAFHRVSANRAAAAPHTMLATSTHDNKRSEDVRARIAVIAELPAAWRLTVRRWSRMNRTRKITLDGGIAPSPNDEYLLYQTLVGTFPPTASGPSSLEGYRGRIESYMIKAAREAKSRTGWLHVDDDYEHALRGFVGALLADRADNRFLDDLRTQASVFAWYGLLNSLTMTLVKLASPGVPDFYQGNEVLDYSLVDPDNRRPVDYAVRRKLLSSLRALEAKTDRTPGDRMRELLASPYDGRAKLWIVYRMLALRRRSRELFDVGSYVPLTAIGSRSRHVLAFARVNEGSGLLVVAGRLFASIGRGVGELPLGDRTWSDTRIEEKVVPRGTLVTDVLSGATYRSDGGAWTLARLFAHFPGAVLAW